MNLPALSKAMASRPFPPTPLHRYRGVYRQGNHYRAEVSFENRVYSLGRSITAEEAAHVRDEAARRLHGKHGRYNVPREGERGLRD